MIDQAVQAGVLDCYAAYAHSLDDGLIEEWAECFTGTGRLETSRPLVVAGRRNLIDFGRLWLAAQPGPTRHASWHHRFTQDGELVRGRCTAALLQTTESGVAVLFTATYRDVFAFEDDAWRIAKRHVAIDVPGTRTTPGGVGAPLLRAVD